MRLLLALVLSAAVLAGCAAPGVEPAPQAAGWALTDTRGEVWSNGTLAGEPALLFFMATWCSSCRTVAPTLADLHEEYGGRVQFLSVGWDPTEDHATLDAWAQERAQPWPHGTDPGRAVVRAFDVRTQSTVVVLGADGEVVWKSGYGPSEGDVRAALERALAG